MKKSEKITIIIISILLIAAIVTGIVFAVIGIVKSNTPKKNPVATITVKNFGTMTVELYPDVAPDTVSNFIALSNRGFYNGLKFHRIIKDFMIQGGDKSGNGSGSPSLSDLEDELTKEEQAANRKLTDNYSIKGEFIANGFEKNTLKIEKGVIAMARSDYSSLNQTEAGYNSAGSQFFIMTGDEYTSLNGLYSGFGKLTEGYDVLESIASVPVTTASTDDNDSSSSNQEVSTPVDPPIIESITVETYGVDYGKPTTLEPFNYYNYIMSQYSGSSTISE